MAIVRRCGAKYLMERWKIDYVGLYDIIEGGLPIYAEDSIGKMIKIDIKDLQNMSPIHDHEAWLAPVRIKLVDVECFEKEHPELTHKTQSGRHVRKSDSLEQGKKLRPNQRHKKKCREVARRLWKEDPTITIKDMIDRQELIDACDKKLYMETTMRNWIKDLCPDRSPGRRPKKPKNV